MAQEIERKFLVVGESFKNQSHQSVRIVQGYLSSVPQRTVRVRLRGDKGFLTVKGITDAGGTTRYEWEKEITAEEAAELLRLCEPGAVDKTRYLVTVGNHLWEVDVFHGENEGLVMAEIELAAPDEPFEKPQWLGQEVTGDERYYNAMLSLRPFGSW